MHYNFPFRRNTHNFQILILNLSHPPLSLIKTNKSSPGVILFPLNSLAPLRCSNAFRSILFKLIYISLGIGYEISLRFSGKCCRTSVSVSPPTIFVNMITLWICQLSPPNLQESCKMALFLVMILWSPKMKWLISVTFFLNFNNHLKCFHR